ncbi:GntR family transcriptional regulator [Marmoricola sp. URHA0025 HA25]
MSPKRKDVLSPVRRFSVDRTSPVPLYYQVGQHLERSIESGEIPNGSLLGNEIALADEMGLSRPTIRRAMQHLVDKGLIVRRRGIGTRVVQPKVRRPLELSSLHDDLARTGRSPTTEVLDLEQVTAPEDVAALLRIEFGDRATRVVRLRRANGMPIAKMTNYLPPHVGDLDIVQLEERGLYDLLRERGIQLHSATQTIGARNATADEARLLAEPRSSSLLTMQRITYDDSGAPVEYGTHVYAASRYSFEIDLLKP